MMDSNEDIHREGGAPNPPAGSSAAPRAASERRSLTRILRDPRTSAATLGTILEDGRLMGQYWIRALVVLRREVPLAVGLRILPSLLWRDLARITEDPRAHAPIRARAEQLLQDRIGEMPLGQRIALARVATRGLVRSLGDSFHPLVIGALLGNPRLVEQDVVALAKSERTPPDILSTIGCSERWRANHSVKMALAQNPRCPPVASLRALNGLPSRDLETITDNPSAAKLVRLSASRRLSGRSDASH